MKEHVRFEVKGKVIDVEFLKCSKQEAKKLNLNGWCKGTIEGSVIGEI